VVCRFHPTDEASWLTWLGEVTSFAFHSPRGSLNVYRETRPRGGAYWYAYHTDRGGIRKRYLGQTAQVTLARLEETAQALASASPRLPHALVERQRLLSMLDGALATPLTLLSASTGWGKTTLLSTWASRHGEASTVRTWVFSLPDPVLHAHIRLALDAALRFVNSANLGNETLYVSMVAQVAHAFTRLEALLQSQRELALSDAEIALIGRRLRLLRALLETRAIIQHSGTERLRQLAQETEALPQDEEVGWNIIPLFLTFRLIAVLQGEGAALISRLLAAKQQVAEARDFLATIRVMSWLALCYIQSAQLHRAKRECLEGLRLAEHFGGRTFLEVSLLGAGNALRCASSALRATEQ
jgi:hypothetical protein